MRYDQIRVLLICWLFLQAPLFVLSQNLSLQATGNPKDGFTVNVLYNNKLITTSDEEFSLQLFNLDLSTDTAIQWKGQKWSGDNQNLTLKGTFHIMAFDANLSVTVNYKVMNQHLLKKEVRLFQPSMPDMHYILKETTRPAEKPLRYTTFEYDSFPGGLVHEMYPSAGFITRDNFVVGLLTDAGYKNQYTRNTRRRFSGRGGGFTGWRR